VVGGSEWAGGDSFLALQDWPAENRQGHWQEAADFVGDLLVVIQREAGGCVAWITE
jgi:hypothetical protein